MKGPSVAMILGGKPPEGAEEDVEMEEKPTDYEGAFSEAADSIFDAVSSGDRSGFEGHLKDAIEVCVEKMMSGD
jgi:hypothetical protein|tara:strand:- start:1402 stop:1623 length:222 start_codon:yes stop_codon:yes gene_type:complete